MLNEGLKSWLDTQLSQTLGFPSCLDIVNYVLSMDSSDEKIVYLRDMLDVISNPERIKIIEEFQEKLSGLSASSSQSLQSNVSKEKNPSSPSKSTKKEKTEKPKYVNFYNNSNVDGFTLSGRHLCNCQSLKHELINNCLNCGRIVCKQEGSGPCLFCGVLVCTKNELEIINRKSNKSEALIKKLMGPKKEYEDSMAKAESHKQRLLDFDKSCEKRTKVIDDESDYFTTDGNQWLTKEQRDLLKKREENVVEERHGSRLKKKITLSFTGKDERENSKYDPSKDKILEEIDAIKAKMDTTESLRNPFLKRPGPTYVSKSNGSTTRKVIKETNLALSQLKVQDTELQIMSDNGMCMSMHQPWASYLVAGIKIHEGRTWYSSHRGKLWIHAASKEPNENEVKSLQLFYQKIYGDKIEFPKELPTSCILGSVEVTNVLPQNEYREEFPLGESDSPYVFICSDPQELSIKIPLSGQHKIYKLDSMVHQSLKKASKLGPINSNIKLEKTS